MTERISYDLLRTLAEEAYDRGDMERAAQLAQPMDEAMLQRLQEGEGNKVSPDEGPLIVPTDRT